MRLIELGKASELRCRGRVRVGGRGRGRGRASSLGLGPARPEFDQGPCPHAHTSTCTHTRPVSDLSATPKPVQPVQPVQARQSSPITENLLHSARTHLPFPPLTGHPAVCGLSPSPAARRARRARRSLPSSGHTLFLPSLPGSPLLFPCHFHPPLHSTSLYLSTETLPLLLSSLRHFNPTRDVGTRHRPHSSTTVDCVKKEEKEEGKEPLGLPLISRRLEFTDSFVSPDPNPENWQPNNVADPSPKNRHGLSDTHNNNYLQALQSSGTFFASSTFEVQSVALRNVEVS